MSWNCSDCYHFEAEEHEDGCPVISEIWCYMFHHQISDLCWLPECKGFVDVRNIEQADMQDKGSQGDRFEYICGL